MLINDLKDNERWRKYLSTIESLWYIDKDFDKEKGDFHGGFVLQIPLNLIQLYTRKLDLVYDLTGGSGTTCRAAHLLCRNSVLFDIRYDKNWEFEDGDTYHRFVNSDTTDKLFSHNHPLADLTIVHPPYFDVIKFTTDDRDLSNMMPDDYILAVKNLLDNARKVTKIGKYFCVVLGDTYRNGRVVQASQLCQIEENLAILKAIFVKNIKGNEKGMGQQTNLKKYRALMQGWNIFTHEYIYVFKRVE